MHRLARPQRQTSLSAEVMDGEILLYDPRGEKVIALNPTATLIWNLCDGTRTVAAIIELLGQAYPEARAEIAGEVEQVLDMLLAHQALSERLT